MVNSPLAMQHVSPRCHTFPGGVGVVAPKRDNAQPRMEGIVVVEDDHWQADAKGQPGEELALHLQVRINQHTVGAVVNAAVNKNTSSFQEKETRFFPFHVIRFMCTHTQQPTHMHSFVWWQT